MPRSCARLTVARAAAQLLAARWEHRPARAERVLLPVAPGQGRSPLAPTRTARARDARKMVKRGRERRRPRRRTLGRRWSTLQRFGPHSAV